MLSDTGTCTSLTHVQQCEVTIIARYRYLYHTSYTCTCMCCQYKILGQKKTDKNPWTKPTWTKSPRTKPPGQTLPDNPPPPGQTNSNSILNYYYCYRISPADVTNDAFIR